MQRTAALLRALAGTAGRSAVQRALPLYLGLFLLASVLFGGAGSGRETSSPRHATRYRLEAGRLLR
ncbi:MAG TPA: hypothetical protein VG963_04395 [Polyangiaceae bacterium]|nr:hypothetical protein [Polyangiaceae bacterium]